jgi:molecular chaperone DnaK (HSP70)
MKENNNLFFKKAETLVEMEKSGNPQSKYQSGSIRNFSKKAEESGEYKSYIEDVIVTTEKRLPELKEKIEENEKATFSPSLEHTDPKEYRRQKAEEERLEDIEELKNKINNILN